MIRHKRVVVYNSKSVREVKEITLRNQVVTIAYALGTQKQDETSQDYATVKEAEKQFKVTISQLLTTGWQFPQNQYSCGPFIYPRARMAA